MLRKFRSFGAAAFLCRFRGNHRVDAGCNFQWKDNGLYIPGKEIILSKKEIRIFNGHINTICKLANGYKLCRDEKYGLCIVTFKFGKEVKIIADDNLVLFATDEIFREELYDFESGKEYVVLDVGMNRGIAGLFFSCYSSVRKIYGYEPFEDTLKLAAANFEINPGLKDKIIIRPYGWGRKDAVIKVPFTEAGFLGATTTSFFIEKNKAGQNDKNISMANVNLRSASKELQEILTKHPGAAICLKLDCEGAEYEILEELEDAGMLTKVSMIMAEWHFIDKRNITDRLLRNGFVMFAPNRADALEMGMIYAFNKADFI